MESEVAALKLAFSTNNAWFEWSTIVVLAGLAFELVTLLVFHKTASWREKSILIAGTLIIAIGVAGEWHFGSKASSAALRLQAISDEKVATLGKDTADAKRDAANAVERAAKLEKEAAALRLQLAERTAPLVARRLSPDQIETLVRELSGSGLIVGVTSGGGDDKEIKDFADDFVGAFRAANILGGMALGGSIRIGGNSIIPNDLTIVGPDGPERSKLEAAFKAASIQFGTRASVLPPGIQIGGMGGSGLTVVIGPRSKLAK